MEGNKYIIFILRVLSLLGVLEVRIKLETLLITAQSISLTASYLREHYKFYIRKSIKADPSGHAV